MVLNDEVSDSIESHLSYDELLNDLMIYMMNKLVGKKI